MDIGPVLVRARECSSKIPLGFSCIVGIIALFILAGCMHQPVEPNSGSDELPRSVGPIANPKPANPVALTPGSVDAFLVWIQGVPQSEIGLIRKQIADAANDKAVIDTLSTRLFEIPVQDIGRHLMILSILGETKNEHALAPLMRFVWYKDPLVKLPAAELGPGNHTSFFNYDGGLRARASEMAANIGSRAAMAATLDVVHRHPTQEVRLAAIDAYLFQLHDSEKAKAELQRVVQPEERKMIGLPRRTRDMDVKDFDARLRAFYERYPEEVPPVPVQILHDPQTQPTAIVPKQQPASRVK